ncbi:MAG: extracellular solute-binding protein [Chloroflexi bacterium]|nr:extracellular solute-binding protein [Chloroflexota bacterium]
MKRVMYAALIVSVFGGSLLAGCAARQEGTTDTRPGPAGSPVMGTAETFDQQWKKLVEAAKKEGTVSVYTSNWIPETLNAIRTKFAGDFGVDVEFSPVGAGSEQMAKMERERSAGLFVVDVIGGGLPTTVVMKQSGLVAPVLPMLMLPEVNDPRMWFGGNLLLDSERKYHIQLSGQFDSFLSRNTELVKEGEIASFNDLLNPKWRGKIVFNDPTDIGGGNSFVTVTQKLWGPDKSREFLTQLVRQEPFLSRDYRLQAEWVARGRVALGLGVPVNQLMTFKKMGATIAFVRAKEGGRVTGGPGGMAVPSGKLPHPNAAKLFVNWMLTREGATVFSRAMSQPAWRQDVTTEGLEDLVPSPGSAVEDEDTAILNTKNRTLAKEIFAPLLK